MSVFYGDQDPLDATYGRSVNLPLGPPPAAPLQPTPGEFGPAIAAETNSVVGMANAIMRARPDDTPTPGYDSVPLVAGTKYEPYMGQFLGDVNEAQTHARMHDIDEHENNREIMANSGWLGTAAAFESGVADPIFWLVPGGEAAAGARGLGAVLRGARVAGEVGAVTAVQQGILQSTNPVHTWAESAENVGANAVLSGILGTGMAYLSPAERLRASTALSTSRAELAGQTPSPAMTQALSEVGAAAEDRRTMTPTPLGGEALRGFVKTLPFGQEGLDQFDRAVNRSAWLDPESRILNKGSLPGRRALGDLSEVSTHLTQEEQGIPAARGGYPIETQVRSISDRLNAINSSILQDQFAKYRGMEGERLARQKAFLQDARGQSSGLMSFDDFKKQTYLALDQGDQHAVPEVQAAAQGIRQSVLDPVKELLQGVKDKNGNAILGDVLGPPKGSITFVPRLWASRAIAADPNEFDRRVAAWLAKEQNTKHAIKTKLSGLADQAKAATRKVNAAKDPDAVAEAQLQHAAIRKQIEEQVGQWEGTSSQEARAALRAREKYEADRAAKIASGEFKGEPKRLESADVAVDRAIKHIMEAPTDRTTEELHSLAAEIRNRINITPEGRLPYDEPSHDPFGEGFSGMSNDFRGSLNARGFAIPTKDMLQFIHTDLEHVVPAFLRNVVPDALLIDRFGDIRMTETLKQINEAYDKLLEGKSDKQALKVDKARKAEMRDVTAIRDRIRGVYGLPTTEWERNLGRMAHVAMQYNVLTMLNSSVINRFQDIMNATSRRGLAGYMRDGFVPFLRGMAGVKSDKAMRQMVKDMQIGVDTRLGHLATNFAYVSHDYLPGTRFERTLKATTRGAMIANLHGPWTDMWRQVAALAAHADYIRMIERVTRGGEKPGDVSRLAYAGIDRGMAERIWKNFEAGHTEINGSKIPNTQDWETGPRQAYEAALHKEANSAVAMPGANRPLAYSKPLLALALQFRSFENAIWRRTIIPNMQVGDFRALQGFLLMLGMGALSLKLYAMASGRDLSSYSPEDWLKEAVLRSGIIGPFSSMNTLQAKVTNGQTDVFRLIGAGRPATRHDQTNFVEEALGPTFKELLGLGMTIPNAMGGTASAKDINNLRQTFLPLQNHMFFRRLLDQAEDGLDRRLGIRPMNRNPSTYPGARPPLQ